MRPVEVVLLQKWRKKFALISPRVRGPEKASIVQVAIWNLYRLPKIYIKCWNRKKLALGMPLTLLNAASNIAHSTIISQDSSRVTTTFSAHCTVHCEVEDFNVNFANPGMNLLSKFCIAVSATRKLNCVAVGVICVAGFFFVFWRKKFLNSVMLSQLNQSRQFWKKKDSPSAAAMKWSDVKHFCKPLRKHSSLFAPQITSSFKMLLEVPSTKALHVVIFCYPWSDEEFSCTVCKNQRNRPCWTFFKI